jgi:hypothetical protein
LSQDLDERSIVALRGPEGFHFPENCFSSNGVITNPSSGLGVAAQQLLQHASC